MIDTDKYEGHTEAPWKYNDKWGLIKYGQIEIAALHSGNSANAQLIADAPLLLQEVKRLRGVVAKVWDLIQNSNHEEREMFFWGFDKKNTGWIKRYEELAMKELKWEWWGEEE